MTRLISSQEYRDPRIVAEKRAAEDYVVTVVTIDSLGVAVVIDGHHSLTAAEEAGVEPEIVECHDADVLWGLDDVDGWLVRHWLDSDYRYVDNGQLVF